MLAHFSDDALPVERFIGFVTKCTVSKEATGGDDGLVDAFVSTIWLEDDCWTDDDDAT